MSVMIQQHGYPYAFNPEACGECGGRCCTGESGNIFVTPEESLAIAAVLGVAFDAFVEGYLHKRGYRFSIREVRRGDSFDCVFFDAEGGGCRVYEARPQQCRTFPFWDYYRTRVDELKAECPGVVDA